MKPNFMAILGAIVLVGVGLYYAFYAADSVGLDNLQGTAVVTAKEHRAAGQTYSTEKVGNTTRVIPRATPEMYLLKLRVEEKDTAYPVSRDIYDAILEGNQVNVTYQLRRLTGAVQIVDLKRQ
jgi:hypothetical protein